MNFTTPNYTPDTQSGEKVATLSRRKDPGGRRKRALGSEHVATDDAVRGKV